jgi:hypothetical protein
MHHKKKVLLRKEDYLAQGMVIWLLLQMLMDPGVIHSAGLGG